MLGAGAAGYAITMMLKHYGFGDIVVYDSAGPIYRGRTKGMNPYKQKLAEETNKENIKARARRRISKAKIFL